MPHDIINGLFELLGGAFLFRNVFTLYRHKQVKGVSVLSTSFFMAWGVWNLWFYPAVDCWWSFVGGIVIVVANTIWVTQMIYYSYFQRHVSR